MFEVFTFTIVAAIVAAAALVVFLSIKADRAITADHNEDDDREDDELQ
ncbi:MAG TPA: hypothetical protein VGA59_06585 [Ramlibacter sp.]